MSLVMGCRASGCVGKHPCLEFDAIIGDYWQPVQKFCKRNLIGFYYFFSYMLIVMSDLWEIWFTECSAIAVSNETKTSSGTNGTWEWTGQIIITQIQKYSIEHTMHPTF